MNLLGKIAALKEGDEFIFGETFKEFHQKIYYYILSKTRSGYLAEEVTQLTFIKLWNNRARLDESLLLSTQIFQIAKTTCIDLLRQQANQHILTNSAKTDQLSTNNVSESLNSHELQRKLIQEVEKMPPMRRKIFELSRFESKTYKEIAQLLSLSEKTVENHIGLALKQLRRVFLILSLFFLR
jgi:RNA polymerase sigma-70 factor (ECF subfamily)